VLLAVKLTRNVRMTASEATLGLAADSLIETARAIEVADDPAPVLMALTSLEIELALDPVAVSDSSLVLIAVSDATLGDAAARMARACFTRTTALDPVAALTALATRTMNALADPVVLRTALTCRVTEAAADPVPVRTGRG